MALIIHLFTIIAAFFTWNLVSLLINYQRARKTGLPVVISPVYPLNPLWILTQKHLVPYLKSLPFGWGQFARCTYLGWQYDDKYVLHQELGVAFIVANPTNNELVLAEPDAVTSVLARRKDFIKPAVMYEQMNIFGPNVNTVEGDDWQRHRKLTAPSFSERVSSSVWKETLHQAQDMISFWENQKSGINTHAGDTATLTLHVLSSTGFGTQYAFSEGVGCLQDGFTMTYKEALYQILSHIVLLAIFPSGLLRHRLLPKKFRDVGQATLEFRKYMEQTIARKPRTALQQDDDPENLTSVLVSASETAKNNTEKGKPLQGLSEDEIFGNVFMYNLAGHETTSSTIAAAIVRLTASPDWQNLLCEEIVSVFGEQNIETWNYETAFPKLKRCLAVMFETLRLHGPTPFIPKSTGHSPQTLTINNVSRSIPANTFVTINSQALHTNPLSWGSDALSWRPDRWLATIPDPSGVAATEYSLIEPEKGTYVPWADGPRNCPGRKFAQVEFVAVMAALFGSHVVRPKLLDGESKENARLRCVDVVNDCAILTATLGMKRPESVTLLWTRR